MTTKMFKYQIEGYLTDFQCSLTGNAYDISQDVQLIRLNSEEQSSFTEPEWFFIYVEKNRPEWKLTKSIEVECHVGSDAAEKMMGKLLTAFRLTHSGGVEIRTIKCSFNSNKASATYLTYLRTFQEGLYILKENDLAIVSEIYGQLQKPLNGKLNTALSRFNLSYHEHRLEDKLIDYVIILEALLLKNKQELALTLALNYVCLLHGASKKEEQEGIFKFLKKTYSLRSDLVHGSIHELDKTIKIDDKEIPKEDFIKKLKERIRALLKSVLKDQNFVSTECLTNLTPFK